MYRATTPTHTFKMNIESSTLTEILVTYKQGDVTLEKHYQDGTLPPGMSLSGKNVAITLTQEETLMFDPGKYVKTQMRVLTNGNEVFASRMFDINLFPVLNEEILS